MKKVLVCLIFLSVYLCFLGVTVTGKAIIPPIVRVENDQDVVKMKQVVEKEPQDVALKKSEDKDSNNGVDKEIGDEKEIGGEKDIGNEKEVNDKNVPSDEKDTGDEKDASDVKDTGDEKDISDEKETDEDKDEDEESSLYESYEDKKDKMAKFEAEPPEHWDGIRLERNGKINGDVEQELFLGPDHEDFESIPEEVGKEKLMEIFKLVDTDGDARLSMAELIDWITLKTKEHFREAVEASKTVFPKVDTDGDGKLTWDEYTIQFLKQRGYSKSKIEKYKKGKQVLQEHDEEDNAIYRDRWETADENGDDVLTPEEFVSFMHPEHSENMLNIVVEEVLHELDQNGDKKLTLAEFVSVPLGKEGDLLKMEKEDDWIRGRREEFETRIDMNNDGIASFNELKAYMDPKNKQHAEGEARHLMGAADDNNDGLLSPHEVLASYYVFIGSKVYNYARNVHDEF